MEQTVWIKMLRTVGEYSEGERYEIDEATAKAWEKADACEVLDNNPETELLNTFQKRLEERDRNILEKLTEAVKVETPKLPAVAKSNDDWSFGDFAFHVATKNRDYLVNKYGEKTLSVGSDSALVPTPLAQQVLQSRGFEGSILSRVNRVHMPSDTYKYAVLDQAGVSPSSGSSAYFGSVHGNFDSEDDDANDTEPAFTSITLNAIKYTMSTQATLEIRQDSIAALDTFLTDTFSRAFNSHMDHFILNGAGGGSAITGVIDHASTKAQTRVTANNISYTDVVNMISGMASDGPDWFWIVSNSALPELLNLEDSGGNLVYQANANSPAAKTLLGYPCQVSQYAATLGSSGDLLLCNMRDGYVFGERLAPTLSFSDHVQFIKGRRVWKLEARIDGRPVHASTITLADGSTTVSEVVQLDSATS